MKRRSQLTVSELAEKQREVEHLAKAFDLLGVHIHITDNHGVIIYANPVVEEITGFTRTQIIGNNAGDLWGGQQPKEFYQEMWQTLKDARQTFRGVVQNRRADGRPLLQEMHITPVLDPLGDAQYFVSVQVELPDRRRARRPNPGHTQSQ